MKLKYEFEMVELGDEIIAVPLNEGANQLKGVLKLNKTGKEVMLLLKEEKSEQDIIDLLATKYENDITELKMYVTKFLNSLKEKDIL